VAGTVSRASEGHVTAWLFLLVNCDPVDLTLELAFLDGEGNLRRYRVTAMRERKR
jgi:hypothetical protein